MKETAGGKWALVLGASSGFGAACSVALAKGGFNIFGVHLDRKSTMDQVEKVIESVKSTGREVVFFNKNAADEEARNAVLDEMHKALNGEPGVAVLLHSLAFGTLRPYLAEKTADSVSKAQLEMTMDVMANSLVYWAQGLFNRRLLARGGRIFAMTSAGDERVWATYGPVSAAKAALEAHIRQLSVELAPHGVTANAIRAGVTDTPALRKIPGNDRMIEMARSKNPYRRLTTTEDVAGAIVNLCSEGCGWITGNVINVDGGEFIVD
ncbi:MAG: SDR family oxidoreductase [Nitrospirae bacterium]|nr:SDR family oxidoreductase [Nitrospirota bacterium]